jgi:hypothetical protein
VFTTCVALCCSLRFVLFHRAHRAGVDPGRVSLLQERTVFPLENFIFVRYSFICSSFSRTGSFFVDFQRRQVLAYFSLDSSTRWATQAQGPLSVGSPGVFGQRAKARPHSIVSFPAVRPRLAAKARSASPVLHTSWEGLCRYFIINFKSDYSRPGNETDFHTMQQRPRESLRSFIQWFC